MKEEAAMFQPVKFNGGGYMVVTISSKSFWHI